MKKKGYKWSILGSAVAINAVTWLACAFFFPQDAPTAILHYNVETGIDFIDKGFRIFTIPGAGIALLALNALVGLLLVRSQPRVAWLVWSVTPLIQLILLLSVFVLIRFNA